MHGVSRPLSSRPAAAQGLLQQVQQQHGFTLTSRKLYRGSGMKGETANVLIATFDGGEELIFDRM